MTVVRQKEFILTSGGEMGRVTWAREERAGCGIMMGSDRQVGSDLCRKWEVFGIWSVGTPVIWVIVGGMADCHRGDRGGY
jgi:hypothetical protein